MQNEERKWIRHAFLVFAIGLLIIATPFSMPASAKTDEKTALAGKSPPYGGVFKIGLQGDLKSLNPCIANDEQSWKVLGVVYDSLSGLSKVTMEPIPWTAESWSEDTPDHLNWSVCIRKNLTWHDGQPLTADDVVFTYNFLRDVGRYAGLLESLNWTPLPGATDLNETYFVGVQKLDNYTVKFRLWHPNPSVLLDVMGIPLLPKHIWRNHWHDRTTWNMDWNPTTGEANVIGSGPFKFKYWKQGVEARIERNPDYFWEATLEDGNTYKVPFVDAIQFIVYKNTDALITALKQGVIDYIWKPLEPGNLSQVSQIPGVKVFVNDDNGYSSLLFNLILPFEGYDEGTGYQPRGNVNAPITYPNPLPGEDPALAFRKAVSYCIDKDYIVNASLQGFGTKGDSIVPPAYSYWYNESLPQYPYSVDTAKSILDGANYTDANSDGWREDYKGRVMDGANNNGQIDILTPSAEYDSIKAEAGIKIAEAMRSAGIKAQVSAVSPEQISDALFSQRNFELGIFEWKVGIDPRWVYDFFNSRFDWYNLSIASGGSNVAGYRNRNYDNLSSQVLGEMEPATRVALVKDCQGMIAQHLPTNVLYYRKVIEAADGNDWSGYFERFGGIGNRWTLMEIHLYSPPQPPFQVYLHPFPYTIEGRENATVTLTAMVYKSGSPYPGVNVSISFEPELDPAYLEVVGGTQKVTDANGKAYFYVRCKADYPMDTVFQAIATATDGIYYRTANTYFTITMAGLNVEATSPKIVDGTAGTVFYFNASVRQFTTPLPDAQVEIHTLWPGDNLKIVDIRANTDANGSVSLRLQVTANFTASTPVELKYTVWPAGGSKTLYIHNFVVRAQGGSDVEITAESIGSIEGLPGRTKEVNVTVKSHGSPLAGASLYGFVSPGGKGLSVVETGSVETGADGRAGFTLRVDALFTLNTTFKFVAIVASGSFAGYAETPVLVTVPGVPNIYLSISNNSEVAGISGARIIAIVEVLNGTEPIPNVSVELVLNPGTGLSTETGKKTDSDGKASINITVTQNFSADATVSVKAVATIGNKTYESPSATLRVKYVSYAITVTLEKNQVDGKKDTAVNATVTVKNGTTPMPEINVTLTAFPCENIQITPANTKTDANGSANFTIMLIANFTNDSVISFLAKATIEGAEYTGGDAKLVIKGVAPVYEVTMTLEKTEIEGRKGNTVNATISVRAGGHGVPNLTVSVCFDKSGLSANTVRTDENGTAIVTLTITEDFTAETNVKVIPRVGERAYQEQAVNLTVKPKAAPTTPGFEFLLVIAAIAIVSLLLYAGRKKDRAI